MKRKKKNIGKVSADYDKQHILWAIVILQNSDVYAQRKSKTQNGKEIRRNAVVQWAALRLRCESDRLMCSKIENQQQYQQRKITNEKWASKKNHRNNYLPHNFITYDRYAERVSLLCLCTPFISFKASSRSYFRQSMWLLFHSLYRARALTHTHKHRCSTHIFRWALTKSRFGIFRILNNYRLTDSIIQTTWNIKLPYFLNDEHMLARLAVDFLSIEWFSTHLDDVAMLCFVMSYIDLSLVAL